MIVTAMKSRSRFSPSSLLLPLIAVAGMFLSFSDASAAVNEYLTNSPSSDYTINSNLSLSAVPEPSSYLLFGLGGLALVIAYRRRR